ncbi:MAG TPA: hypothetical protein VN605_11220 [Thermoanaerobaculia bacterium]|nr:hypothetical protein [Thermoanaerobaculia bacterium]
MMKTATVALLLLTLIAPVTFAADEPLAGHYRLDAKASDNVGAAIESQTASMNFITRPIARGRLKKTNPAYETIGIAFPTNNISVALDQRKPIVFPASGTAVKWTREDGEKFDLSGHVTNGVLTQTFVAEDGRRTNTYTLSPDGKMMTLNVKVESPRLPKPVTYKLVYHRV